MTSLKILMVVEHDYVFTNEQNGCMFDAAYIRHIAASIPLTVISEIGYVVSMIETSSYDVAVFYISRRLDTVLPLYDQFRSLGIPVLTMIDDLFHVESILTSPGLAYSHGVIATSVVKRIQDELQARGGRPVVGIIPQYTSPGHFRDFQLEKEFDVLLFGLSELDIAAPLCDADRDYFTARGMEVPSSYNFYPFRQRLFQLFLSPRIRARFRVKHLPATANGSWDCPVRGEALGRLMNQSWLVVSTRSRADKCMHKYIEIAASGSVPLGDIPSDYRHAFSGNMVELTDSMTDDEIIAVVSKALRDREELQAKKTRLLALAEDWREQTVPTFLAAIAALLR